MGDGQDPRYGAGAPNGGRGTWPTAGAPPESLWDRPPRPPWWRPSRYGWQVLAIVVATVVVLAGSIAFVAHLLTRTSALPAPTALPHDPVPALGKPVTEPRWCGMTRQGVEALVPRADHPTGCVWTHQDPAKGTKRELTIGFSAERGRPGITSAQLLPSPATAVAVRMIVSGEHRDRPGMMRVTGLGDEATVVNDDDTGATVTMRVRNAIVDVRYSGGDEDSSRYLDPKRAVAGALRGAATVAQTLGAPHRPATAPAQSRPAAHSVLSACRSVSSDLLDRLVPTSSHGAGIDVPVTGHGKARACSWAGSGNAVSVTLTRYDDTARPGSGTRRAEHNYLASYLSARAAEQASTHHGRYFAALTGPAQQAFAFSAGGAPGARVVFRDRNVIAEVRYGAQGGPALPRDEAVDGAYAAATQVAAFLRAH